MDEIDSYVTIVDVRRGVENTGYPPFSDIIYIREATTGARKLFLAVVV
jgi:hypothetical protein